MINVRPGVKKYITDKQKKMYTDNALLCISWQILLRTTHIEYSKKDK